MFEIIELSLLSMLFEVGRRVLLEFSDAFHEFRVSLEVDEGFPVDLDRGWVSLKESVEVFEMHSFISRKEKKIDESYYGRCGQWRYSHPAKGHNETFPRGSLRLSQPHDKHCDC